MVARISTGQSIRGALSYNERKVGNHVADLILASGFPEDENNLGFSAKLNRFEQLIARNDEIETNTLHISLNFPPEERPSREMLRRIGVDYMTRIGFGGQPFLIYEHNDAAHSHIHIVTTNIKSNGRYINLHNIAKNKSEPARKALEQEYGLITAEGRNQSIQDLPPGINLDPAIYGKEPTKAKISNVVREVTTNYKITSLDELNAALRHFNVFADHGPEGSIMRERGGLVYTMLDNLGYKRGIPIKASKIFTKPTLKNLQIAFLKNQVKKSLALPFVQKKITSAFSRCSTAETFLKKLSEKDVSLHILRNKQGTPQSILFVDRRAKAIFSNEELGISNTALLQKLYTNEPTPVKVGQRMAISRGTSKKANYSAKEIAYTGAANLLKTLMAQNGHSSGFSIEYPIKKKKKKKRPSL